VNAWPRRTIVRKSQEGCFSYMNVSKCIRSFSACRHTCSHQRSCMESRGGEEVEAQLQLPEEGRGWLGIQQELGCKCELGCNDCLPLTMTR
jgi:hypothetical protein